MTDGRNKWVVPPRATVCIYYYRLIKTRIVRIQQFENRLVIPYPRPSEICLPILPQPIKPYQDASRVATILPTLTPHHLPTRISTRTPTTMLRRKRHSSYIYLVFLLLNIVSLSHPQTLLVRRRRRVKEEDEKTESKPSPSVHNLRDETTSAIDRLYSTSLRASQPSTSDVINLPSSVTGHRYRQLEVIAKRDKLYIIILSLRLTYLARLAISLITASPR